MGYTPCPFLLMDNQQSPPHPDTRRQLQMARSMCWHCQSEVTGEYFCDRCVKVQPVSKDTDYFTCFGVPRRLLLDPKKLEAKFYELSRTFHPDFYQTKSADEQTISLSNAAVLNTAYRTLRDPIQRAEYLLALETGSVKDIRTSPPADLFEEILDLQDTLEEYRASERDSDQGHRLRATLQTEQEALGAAQGRDGSSTSAIVRRLGQATRRGRSHEPGEGGTGQNSETDARSPF